MMELGLLFSAVEKQNNPPPKKNPKQFTESSFEFFNWDHSPWHISQFWGSVFVTGK